MSGVTHVLFDFFGTLVAYTESRVASPLKRSHALLVAAGSRLGYDEFSAGWDGTFEPYEQRALRDLNEYSMDMVCTDFLQRVLPRELDGALLADFRDTFLEEWSQGVLYIPGVTALLAELSQRYTLVLVTNTHHAALVHGHLLKMEAQRYFHSVVTSVEHGRRKPSPCIFRRALEISDGSPESAIYIGDSYSADYEGSVRAGLRCLLIDPEQRHPIPPEHRIADVLAARALLAPS